MQGRPLPLGAPRQLPHLASRSYPIVFANPIYPYWHANIESILNLYYHMDPYVSVPLYAHRDAIGESCLGFLRQFRTLGWESGMVLL